VAGGKSGGGSRRKKQGRSSGEVRGVLVLFLPQVPYALEGSLLAQVIYPSTFDHEIERHGFSAASTIAAHIVETKAEEAIEAVELTYLTDRWGLHQVRRCSKCTEWSRSMQILTAVLSVSALGSQPPGACVGYGAV
jgi:ABC-type uncharacterized transport system fused permease/ATPase subunit